MRVCCIGFRVVMDAASLKLNIWAFPAALPDRSFRVVMDAASLKRVQVRVQDADSLVSASSWTRPH